MQTWISGLACDHQHDMIQAVDAVSCFCEPFRLWGRGESEKSWMYALLAWLAS